MSRPIRVGATGLPVRILAIAAVAVVAAVGVTTGLAPATAGASAATVSLSPGSNGRPYANGTSLTITVSPNSTFAPYSRIEVLECAAPNGVPPTSDSSCDGNTANGQSVIVAKDGSFEVADYVLYSLPNRALAETAITKPVCNATSECVLYIGQNQNDFTQPKAFSTPFTVEPSATSTPTTGAHPATSTGGSTSAGIPAAAAVGGAASSGGSSSGSASGGTASSGTSSGGSGSGGGPGGVLAFTGVADLPWLLGIGTTLVVVGTAVRRRRRRVAP